MEHILKTIMRFSMIICFYSLIPIQKRQLTCAHLMVHKQSRSAWKAQKHNLLLSSRSTIDILLIPMYILALQKQTCD